MAVLYLDNDISARLGPLLRAAHHQVIHTKERQQAQAPDEQQLLTALQLNASLVTHNYRDFQLLHRAWLLWAGRWQVTEPHPPILVLPQGPEPQLCQCLGLLLQGQPPARNTLYRFRPSAGWTTV